jgi:hypothetical protein
VKAERVKIILIGADELVKTAIRGNKHQFYRIRWRIKNKVVLGNKLCCDVEAPYGRFSEKTCNRTEKSVWRRKAVCFIAIVIGSDMDACVFGSHATSTGIDGHCRRLHSLPGQSTWDWGGQSSTGIRFCPSPSVFPYVIRLILSIRSCIIWGVVSWPVSGRSPARQSHAIVKQVHTGMDSTSCRATDTDQTWLKSTYLEILFDSEELWKIFYLLVVDIATLSVAERQMIRWLKNYELQRIWKEAVVTNLNDNIPASAWSDWGNQD